MRTCRKWTEAETQKTLVLLAEGKSMNDIGRILGRSHHTVRANMAKIDGYVPRPKGRPRGNVCQPLTLRPKGAPECNTVASRMLMVSLRVSV